MRKLVACALVAALVVAAPGIPAYAAAGEAFERGAKSFTSPNLHLRDAASRFEPVDFSPSVKSASVPKLAPGLIVAPAANPPAGASRDKFALQSLEDQSRPEASLVRLPLAAVREAAGSGFEGWRASRPDAQYGVGAFAAEEGPLRPSGLEPHESAGGSRAEPRVPAPRGARRALQGKASAAKGSLLSLFAGPAAKRLLGGAPADESLEPETFALTRELSGLINAKRAAWGQKPAALPEIVALPIDVPAVFAGSRLSARALVGVSSGLRRALFDSRELSGLLVGLLMSSEPAGKPFRAYRMAVAGSLPGVGENSNPGEAAQAVMRASPADLQRLAMRVLRGLLARELSQLSRRHGSSSEADEAGATLTEDPEALALGLGLLSSWRPRPGFSLSRRQRAGLAALSPLSALHPLRQLEKNGADVRSRVEGLYDMAEYLRSRGGRQFWPQPPPEGGAALFSPAIALRPQLAAPAAPEAAGGGFLERLSKKVKSLWRIVPDKLLNKEFWKITGANVLISIGGSFHYSALLGLVAPTDQLAYRVPWIRAVNYSAQLTSSLAMGEKIDRSPNVKSLLVGTSYGRAALLLLGVTGLFFVLTGNWYFAALNFVFFGAGFLQSTAINAGTVGFNEALGDDEAYYSRGNAVFNFSTNLFSIPSPLIAIVFIDSMDKHFRPFTGNAMAYGVYGVLMLAAAWIFRTLKLPEDELLAAGRDLALALKGDPRVKGVLGRRIAEKATAKEVPTLFVEVEGDPSRAEDIGKSFPEFKGYPVRLVEKKSVWGELSQGLRLVVGNRFIRWYLILQGAAFAVGDPLLFSALGGHIKDVLQVSDPPAFLSHLPWLGSLLKYFAADGKRIFALYLAASAFGTALSSLFMAMLRNRSFSDLGILAKGFRNRLAARGGLGAERLQAAGLAAKEAVDFVLSRYKEGWKKDPAGEHPLWAFRKDILDEASSLINARAFDGAKKAEEMARLFSETGLSLALSAWAEKHHADLMEEARKEAKDGLTALERQGRWTSIWSGFGWLASLGIFFQAGWGSFGWMIVAMALQGPFLAAFSSLVTVSLNEHHYEDKGKAYAAIFFVQQAFTIAGELLYVVLMRFFAASVMLKITGAAILFVAVCDWIQAFNVKVSPPGQGPVQGPKP